MLETEQAGKAPKPRKVTTAARQLGNRVEYVRTAILHLRRRELAEALDVTREAVVRWENGYGVGIDNLRKISDLNAKIIPFEWLATGKGAQPPAMPGPATAMTLEQRIAHALGDAEGLNFLEEVEALLRIRAARREDSAPARRIVRR